MESNEVTVHPEYESENITGPQQLYRSIAELFDQRFITLYMVLSAMNVNCLVGVGYRAQAKGKVFTELGLFSSDRIYLAEGVTAETLTQTEVIKGVNKEVVGSSCS